MKPSTLFERVHKRGSAKETHEDFFNCLRYQIKVKIKPSNIANMDEHSMQVQEAIAGKVIGDSLIP